MPMLMCGLRLLQKSTARATAATTSLMFLNTLSLSSSFFIVSGQEPESRDAGVSRNTGTGSHLARAGAAESHVGQVERSGSSGNARIGSHLEAKDAAESHVGQVGSSGSSEFTKNGSHLAAAGFSDESEAVL